MGGGRNGGRTDGRKTDIQSEGRDEVRRERASEGRRKGWKGRQVQGTERREDIGADQQGWDWRVGLARPQSSISLLLTTHRH